MIYTAAGVIYNGNNDINSGKHLPEAPKHTGGGGFSSVLRIWNLLLQHNRCFQAVINLEMRYNVTQTHSAAARSPHWVKCCKYTGINNGKSPKK